MHNIVELFIINNLYILVIGSLHVNVEPDISNVAIPNL